jgi:hypothetical protein
MGRSASHLELLRRGSHLSVRPYRSTQVQLGCSDASAHLLCPRSSGSFSLHDKCSVSVKLNAITLTSTRTYAPALRQQNKQGASKLYEFDTFTTCTQSTPCAKRRTLYPKRHRLGASAAASIQTRNRRDPVVLLPWADLTRSSARGSTSRETHAP